MVKTVVFVESLSSLFIAFRDGKKAEKRTLIGIPTLVKEAVFRLHFTTKQA